MPLSLSLLLHHTTSPSTSHCPFSLHMGRKWVLPLIIPLLLLLPHQSGAGRGLHSSLWSTAADYLSDHHLHNFKMLKSGVNKDREMCDAEQHNFIACLRRSKEPLEEIILEAKVCEGLLKEEEKKMAKNADEIASQLDALDENYEDKPDVKVMMEKILNVRDYILKMLQTEEWKRIDGTIVKMEREYSSLVSADDKKMGDKTMRKIYELKSSVQQVPKRYVAGMEDVWLHEAESLIKYRRDNCLALLDDVERRKKKGENLLKSRERLGSKFSAGTESVNKALRDFFREYEEKMEGKLKAVKDAVDEMQGVVEKFGKKGVEEIGVVEYKGSEEEKTEKSEIEVRREKVEEIVASVGRREVEVRKGIEVLMEEVSKL